MAEMQQTAALLHSVLFLTEGTTCNSHSGGADLPAEPREHLGLHQLCPELLRVCSGAAVHLQGGLSGMYVFLENHVVVLWVVFKRSWQPAVSHNRDNEKAFRVEAVYCVR